MASRPISFGPDTTAAPAPAAAAVATTGPEMLEAVRHCWVRPDPASVPVPGLLLRWRRSSHGWEGLVVHVDADHAVLSTWLPAAALRPRT